MVEKHTITLEFDNESEVPTEEKLSERIDYDLTKTERNGRYFSFRVGAALTNNSESFHRRELNKEIRYLFEKTDAERIAYSSYEDTVCRCKMKLFELENDKVVKVTEMVDGGWTPEEFEDCPFYREGGSYHGGRGKASASTYLKRKFNFDAKEVLF